MVIHFEFNDGHTAYGFINTFDDPSVADAVISSWNGKNKPGKHHYRLHILFDPFG